LRERDINREKERITEKDERAEKLLLLFFSSQVMQENWQLTLNRTRHFKRI